MALIQNYYKLWFESFRLEYTAGHTSAIQLKLILSQNLPQEIAAECKSRNIDPFGLLTECSTDLFTKYPAGTKFLLKAKLTDKEGSKPFFYSYYRWKPIETKSPS